MRTAREVARDLFRKDTRRCDYCGKIYNKSEWDKFLNKIPIYKNEDGPCGCIRCIEKISTEGIFSCSSCGASCNKDEEMTAYKRDGVVIGCEDCIEKCDYFDDFNNQYEKIYMQERYRRGVLT